MILHSESLESIPELHLLTITKLEMIEVEVATDMEIEGGIEDRIGELRHYFFSNH